MQNVPSSPSASSPPFPVNIHVPNPAPSHPARQPSPTSNIQVSPSAYRVQPASTPSARATSMLPDPTPVHSAQARHRNARQAREIRTTAGLASETGVEGTNGRTAAQTRPGVGAAYAPAQKGTRERSRPCSRHPGGDRPRCNVPAALGVRHPRPVRQARDGNKTPRSLIRDPRRGPGAVPPGEEALRRLSGLFLAAWALELSSVCVFWWSCGAQRATRSLASDHWVGGEGGEAGQAAKARGGLQDRGWHVTILS